MEEKRTRGRPKGSTNKPKPAVTMHADGYLNAVMGSGNHRDRSTATRAQSAYILDQQSLTDMYMADGFAKKIVDIPAEEMTRAGIDVDEIDDGDEKLLMAKLEELDAMRAMNDALRWSRLYGGAVIVIGAMDGGALDVPLNPEGVRDVEFLRVYDRHQATIQRRVTDPASKDYGQPEMWLISPVIAGTAPYLVHHSRVIVIDGESIPDRLRSGNDGWGASVLQACQDQLTRLGMSHQWANALLERAQQAVHSIEGLADILRSPGGEAMVKQRMDLVDMARSILNTVVIDGKESYSVSNMGIGSGVNELIDRFAEALSAVSGIPVFLLMGRSVGGLNSSGKAEMEGWYARIGAMQNDILRKPMDKIVGLILGSMGIDAEYKIEFCPLSVPSEAEEADTELKKAQAEKTRMETDSGYAALGVVDPAELRKSEHVAELYPAIDGSLDVVPMPEAE